MSETNKHADIPSHLGSLGSLGSEGATSPELVLEQQIIQLKKQHQLQHQILLQHFQAQQQHLAEQHEQQLRQHLKEFWEQQKQLQELRKKEQLEALKKKDKHEQSAVASTEVKQKLQVFLMKKQRDAASSSPKGSSASTSTGDQNWNEVMDQSGTNSTSSQYNLESTNPKCDSDFPLRKTASEPNLLKVRIKQRVMERRCNPLTKRGHMHFPPSSSGLQSPFNKKKNSTITSSTSSAAAAAAAALTCANLNASAFAPGNNNIHSTNYNHIAKNCQSPMCTNSHSSSESPGERGSPSGCSATIKEEKELEEYHFTANQLFSSPSMPNISLNAASVISHKKHLAGPNSILTGVGIASGAVSGDVSEAKMRAACTARLGMPLTGQMLTNTLPYYPSLPAIESDATEEMMLGTISELHEVHVHSNRGQKQSIRPLGRTQSSPLPLGHPLISNDSPIYYTTSGTRGGNSTGVPSHHTISSYAPLPEDVAPTDLSSTAYKAQLEQQQHQRDLVLRGAAPSTGSSGHTIRPLSRALSSPVVHLGPQQGPAASILRRRSSGASHTITTGLAFDNQMLKHSCICGNNANHPEHAGRLQSIWARLLETGLTNRCDRLRPRKATLPELQTCHTESHSLLYGTGPLHRQKLELLPVTNFVRLPCGGIGVDSDTTWNEVYTGPAARMAVGCVIDLATKTVKGDIRNGFAVVRPPGHHAERQQAMGFCYFNSVAIAAKVLQKEYDVQKILIFDWDVHHGNGTQDIFYDDPRVLFISIHRHDDGNFFPGTGSLTECGSGAGLGFNVNIAWSGGLEPPLSDAEYLAAFRSIVLPIAKEFNPDVVLVSAGFDACTGHLPQLGGYKVSPACYGYMTKELMQLANGKIVLSLEGGYDLPSICDSAEECVRVLLGDEPSAISEEELSRTPCQNAIHTLQKVIAVQMLHWPCIEEPSKTAFCSFNEALKNEKEEKDTVSAMASLSMQQTSILVRAS